MRFDKWRNGFASRVLPVSSRAVEVLRPRSEGKVLHLRSQSTPKPRAKRKSATPFRRERMLTVSVDS